MGKIEIYQKHLLKEIEDFPSCIVLDYGNEKLCWKNRYGEQKIPPVDVYGKEIKLETIYLDDYKDDFLSMDIHEIRKKYSKIFYGKNLLIKL